MRKKILMILGLAALCAALTFAFAGCGDGPTLGPDPTQTSTVPPEERIEELQLVVTEENISQLKDYPRLKKVDLSGSTCYEAIVQFQGDHPGIQVIYTVDLGGTTVTMDTTSLELEPGSYTFAQLLENLEYLPQVQSLHLPRTGLAKEQVHSLRTTYPGLEISYTVMLLGQELTPDTQSLDLSGLQRDQVEEVAQAIGLLSQLTQVELMGADGSCGLTVEDVQVLTDAAPNAVLHYEFALFGKTVSTTDENIEFVGQKIGDEGEEELRRAMDILSGCKRLVLDDCGFSNEVLDRVRSDYTCTKLVWRVHVAFRSWLTDTEVLRAVYHVDDSNSAVLRYCNEVKYMDLGHNTEMVDISFIAYMPNLEIVILSGSPIEDLSAFAGCQNLEFLELAYCGSLKDVSPLASCPNLKHLNISYSKVSDLRCLDNLYLEQLCYLGASKRISWNEQEDIRDWHADAVVTFSGKQPYGKGWRYVDNGYNFTEIYKKVREVFDYDAIDAIIAGQGGN